MSVGCNIYKYDSRLAIGQYLSVFKFETYSPSESAYHAYFIDAPHSMIICELSKLENNYNNCTMVMHIFIFMFTVCGINSVHMVTIKDKSVVTFVVALRIMKEKQK
ncbi:uncharacterized protein BX663DRAFT_489368 [Cokeromyces recurvatus]|uniref:uncharacterized protein n=1 Tax=Cokeromyces recurvatus TaxID=90255 RepID=UPI00222036E8|nr:uncharacterized protein BX663DRAFT_489368 [Cokeromyces recurvatus]KAI7899254.1 hypothetical protein BX663DRAFT_489368 [Cokeromyces recurvatus]